MKNTKAPWHVGGQEKCTIYDKFGQRIGNTFEGVMATQRSDIECQANAKLMCAAPELLELVTRAIVRLEIAHSHGHGLMREWVVDARKLSSELLGNPEQFTPPAPEGE